MESKVKELIAEQKHEINPSLGDILSHANQSSDGSPTRFQTLFSSPTSTKVSRPLNFDFKSMLIEAEREAPTWNYVFNKITDNLKTQTLESKQHNAKLEILMKDLRHKWLSKENLAIVMNKTI